MVDNVAFEEVFSLSTLVFHTWSTHTYHIPSK